MRKIWITFPKTGILALITLFLHHCNATTKTDESEEDATFCLNETLKSQLQLDHIAFQPIAQQIELTGEVSYDQEKVVHFHSLVNAIAENVFFSLGQYVEKGQVLAEIKSPELNALVLEKKNLNSKIQVAKRELSSQESLFNNNLITELEWMTSKSELENLQLELENTQQTLAMFHANPNRSTFEIRSPISGYIIRKNIQEGSHIMESDELLTISDLREVWVMANIYATDLELIQEGMEVKVKTLAYANKVFDGKIHSISKVFDAEEKVLKARIQLKNTDYQLKPGMVASVLVEISSDKKAWTIAKEEVIFNDNQYYVVVYHSDCHLEVRKLDIIEQNHENYFVEKGFQSNEKIVTQNQLLIFEKIK